VTITDSGIGMTEEVMKHIFVKFYQGDQSRSAEGNGLGLPLVRRIVELCGGGISVESTPGEGSVFAITFPFGGC
jgi:signal transduction histidine kinase